MDSTACAEGDWAAIYKPSNPAGLRCPGCSYPMIAKVSSGGLRFFSHVRRSNTCKWAEEGPEHRGLKRVVADLVRACGATAVLEATPAVGDQGGWRADVMAVTESGRRIAFEIQLAQMTVEVGKERSERYAADDIETVWLSTRNSRWMTRLPSSRLAVDSVGLLTANRGLARLIDGTWSPAGNVEFKKVLQGLLAGSIVSTSVRWFREDVDEQPRYIEDAVVLVSRQDAKRYSDQLALEKRETEAHLEQLRIREQHVQAMLARQDRVLQSVVLDAVDDLEEGAGVWLGVPPSRWDGSLPVEAPLQRGKESTGFGLAVWVGTSRHRLTLWGVICPVAGRCTQGLGYSWRRRGVQVFAESHAEADRLSQALDWEPSLITVVEALGESGNPGSRSFNRE